jgi:hypothetical protein
LVKRVSAAFSRFVHFSDQMQHLKLLRWPEQLRRRGFPHVPLHGLPGSSQFIEAYQAALGNIQPSARVGIRGAPGTVRGLVQSYLRSTNFTNLSPEFQRVRRNMVERFAREHGDKRVATLRRENVQSMLLSKKGTPSAARNFLHALRELMRLAVEVGMIERDPTEGVKRLKIRSDGIRTWTEDEIEKFEAKYPLGTRPRLAQALLLYTGQRVVVKDGAATHPSRGDQSAKALRNNTNAGTLSP